jgi:hypothetical protein
VTVRNDGPAATGFLRAYVPIPAPLQLAGVSGSPGSACVEEIYEGQRSAVCGWTDVPFGSLVTQTVTFTVIGAATTLVSASVTSSAADPNIANNNPTITLNAPPRPPPGPQPPRPRITTTSLQPGYVGEPYQAQIAMAGGTPPYRVRWNFCMPAIPNGLSLTAEGLVGGVPREAGRFPICVTIGDSLFYTDYGADNATFWIDVLRRPPLLIRDELRGAVAGDVLDAAMVSGGRPPYAVRIVDGRLPAGLRLDSAHGRVVGRPEKSGPFSATLQAIDANGVRASAPLFLLVRARPGFATSANELETPGALDRRVRPNTIQTTICSRAWRARPVAGQTTAQRAELLRRYGLPATARGSVVDRLIPVELGGAARNRLNLWPQLASGAAAVDRLERHLQTLVCSGRTTLAAARHRIIERKRRRA